MLRRWKSIVVLVALGASALDLIPIQLVIAPLMAIAIYTVGVASLGSLKRGASHIPDGPPEPVDQRQERVTYFCGGCGAEALLLVRGSAMPLRHCGEKMHERIEVPNTR
jgi:hypothetical protein